MTFNPHSKSAVPSVRSCQDWSLAFTRYICLIVKEVVPKHSWVMDDCHQYHAMFLSLAAKHSFDTMYKYDIIVRSDRTHWRPDAKWSDFNNVVMWRLTGPKPSAQAVTANHDSRAGDSSRSNQSTTSSRQRVVMDREEANRKNVCMKWNAGRQCLPNCNRRHACYFCDAKEHAARVSLCPRRLLEDLQRLPILGQTLPP